MGSSSDDSKEKPQSLLDRVKNADEALSLPVFQLSLPKPVELLLSFPGNLLGPPAVQVVAPMWLFVLDPSNDDQRPNWLLPTALGLTILLLVLPFLLFLGGNLKMMSHVLFSHVSFAVSTLVGIAASYHLGPTPYASALGYHGIILYCLGCTIILPLKHNTRRLRPCVVFPRLIERKKLAIIPKLLAKASSFTSFPSGDAMGSAAWALPLMHLGYTQSALLVASLTAFGRMFFLAHHLGDTLAGIGVSVGFHLLLGVVPGLPAVGTAEWYHPLAAFATLVIASRFRKGDEK